ncbi:MAG: hypothetical protein WCF57_02865 [Pyrinomonadaceae bacterium]
MNCKACRIEIEEAEANELLSAAARAHAETCLPCRAFGSERRSLRQLIGGLETVAAPPDFDFRLRARLAAAGRDEGRRSAWWPQFAPGMSALALAVSLALMIGAGVIFRQVNFTRQDAQRPTEAVATVAPTRERPPQQVVSVPPTIRPVEDRDGDGASHLNPAVQRTLIAANNRRGRSVEALREPKLDTGAGTPAPAATDSGISSIDFDVHNLSPSLTPPGIYNPAVDPNPSIIVPIRALARPAKFIFDEGRVASRVFSLRNVTFGSEKLIEQGNPALVTDTSDIW